MGQLPSEPAAVVAVKCRSHPQASDFDPQVLALRKFHPMVRKSEPSILIDGTCRLLRVSPTFLGFAAVPGIEMKWIELPFHDKLQINLPIGANASNRVLCKRTAKRASVYPD
jgi:hypothetical protein